MQIQRHGRVHSLPAVHDMMVEIERLAGARGGCLIATAMLTERDTLTPPNVIPTGIFGGDTSNLDDVDRAVLVAQLWLVVQAIEKDLGQGSDCGVNHFRGLVEAMRESLFPKPQPVSIETVAGTTAGLGQSECELHGPVVSLGPIGNQGKTSAPAGDL